MGLSLKSPCMMKYVSGNHILSLWWIALRNSYDDWFAYLSLGSCHCCWSKNSTSYFYSLWKNQQSLVLLTIIQQKIINKLTKLDSSGDAKLNNNTLTFTVKVPTRVQIRKWIKNEEKNNFGASLTSMAAESFPFDNKAWIDTAVTQWKHDKVKIYSNDIQTLYPQLVAKDVCHIWNSLIVDLGSLCLIFLRQS